MDTNKKAKEFHSCGLELSGLYDKLRIFKTLNNEKTDRNKELFAQNLTDEYQKILQKYENHETIDHDLFKSFKPKYHKLKRFDVVLIKCNYYFHTSFIYHFLIVLPPILIATLIFIQL